MHLLKHGNSAFKLSCDVLLHHGELVAQQLYSPLEVAVRHLVSLQVIHSVTLGHMLRLYSSDVVVVLHDLVVNGLDLPLHDLDVLLLLLHFRVLLCYFKSKSLQLLS